MSKRNQSSRFPLETLLIVEDNLKGMFLRVGTKCEMKFDIGLLQSICAKKGLELSPMFIKNLIKQYCEHLKQRTARILAIEYEDIPPTSFQVTFTIRMFDGDALPVVDQAYADGILVSAGEWVKASRAGSRKT